MRAGVGTVRRGPSAAVPLPGGAEFLHPRPGVQDAGQHPACRVRVPERRCRSPRPPPRSWPTATPGPAAPGAAAGRTRPRSAARPASITGHSTHSQDGDKIENPANTGCSTHGDFSAPMVSPPGTAGDRPAPITRISSGVTRGDGQRADGQHDQRDPPGPAVIAGRRPARAGSRAQHDHADDPDERHPGEPSGQRHRGPGQRRASAGRRARSPGTAASATPAGTTRTRTPPSVAAPPASATRWPGRRCSTAPAATCRAAPRCHRFLPPPRARRRN